MQVCYGPSGLPYIVRLVCEIQANFSVTFAFLA